MIRVVQDDNPAGTWSVHHNDDEYGAGDRIGWGRTRDAAIANALTNLTASARVVNQYLQWIRLGADELGVRGLGSDLLDGVALDAMTRCALDESYFLAERLSDLPELLGIAMPEPEPTEDPE